MIRPMKTQYYTATSLDGFLADPDHSLEWLFQFGEPGDADYPAFIAEVGAVAMGSSTYEWLLRHHIRPGAPQPMAWPYTQPTWVFSTRPREVVSGADIRFVQGDVRPVHEAMVRAAGGKNVWIVGGGELAGQFADHGLLNELILTYAPVVLGSGAPLFPRRLTTPPFEVVSTRRIGTSFVQITLRIPTPSFPGRPPV
jgi:dihydrofolate reductase